MDAERLRLLDEVVNRARVVWEALRHDDGPYGPHAYDLGRALAALDATPAVTDHGHPQEVCEPCWKAGHDTADAALPSEEELAEAIEAMPHELVGFDDADALAAAILRRIRETRGG